MAIFIRKKPMVKLNVYIIVCIEWSCNLKIKKNCSNLIDKFYPTVEYLQNVFTFFF